MENKLQFLTAKVKFGQQKRYQDWFQKQVLYSNASQKCVITTKQRYL